MLLGAQFPDMPVGFVLHKGTATCLAHRQAATFHSLLPSTTYPPTYPVFTQRYWYDQSATMLQSMPDWLEILRRVA